MEISQAPHEKQYLHCRVSWLETQLSQLLNDNLAVQGQCDALSAGVKFLEDSMANGAASLNPKMVTASKKCKKRRFGTFSKEGPKRDQCLIVHGIPETRVVTGS